MNSRKNFRWSSRLVLIVFCFTFLGVIGCDTTGSSDDSGTTIIGGGGGGSNTDTDNDTSTPDNREATEFIVEPHVTIIGSYSDVFDVTAAAVSRSSSTSSFIYGVVQAEYLGDQQYCFIKIDEARFLDSQGRELFTEWSFFRNVESIELSSGSTTNTFVTPKLPHVHYRIIENLENYDNVIIDDIHTIELAISVSDYEFTTMVDRMEWNGEILIQNSKSWGFDFSREYTNNSETSLIPRTSRLILEDSKGRPFRWTSARSHYVQHDDEGWITRQNDEIHAKETGKLSGYISIPDYIEEAPVISLMTLDWEYPSDPEPESSVFYLRRSVSSDDPDFLNYQLRNKHDTYTKTMRDESIQ